MECLFMSHLFLNLHQR